MIIQELGWVKTLQGLIVPRMFSAFGTFLLRQFFLALPRDIEDAARLDGANLLRAYWHIARTLAKPGLIALTILTALWSWNDLMYPLVVTTDADGGIDHGGRAHGRRLRPAAAPLRPGHRLHRQGMTA
ncbi:carbohydrate ABC transporter permease [Nonomuraea sp. NPDC050451]|uniref:carbohydrate ABC transporter permease n=1 Tax=Nonomuraea sp. NPDC050451 TaxID=3364364 RepID=UPI0037ACD80F